MTITATYSPEDNKLRLYASERLDDETFGRVKAAGFKWAPKQELFVAPAWSPRREDLAIELAGEIEPEGMTLADRAQMKADRLEGYAAKRTAEASVRRDAADGIAERFYGGQPILVGHHSERRARKDQQRIHDNMRAAEKLDRTANNHLYKATSAEMHAERKNSPRVRLNRIKTLLAELRAAQRRITQSYVAERVAANAPTTDADAFLAACDYIAEGEPVVPYSLRSKLRSGEMQARDAYGWIAERKERTLARGSNTIRTIEHLLHRIAYERSFLPSAKRHEGEITDTVLKAYAREFGAFKPAVKRDGDLIGVLSPAPLPWGALPLGGFGVGHACEAWKTADEWRDAMQGVGYEPPAKKDAKPPILNFRADALTTRNPYYRDKLIQHRQVEATRAEYAKVPNDYRGVKLSVCGRYRYRVAMGRYFGAGGDHGHEYVAVFLTDQKAHPAPEAIDADSAGEAA